MSPYDSNARIRCIFDGCAPKYRRWCAIGERAVGLSRQRRQLLERASGRVLDVACGTGENFRLLPRESEITAIDLSPGMLAEARQRAGALVRDIDLHEMDAAALGFPDDSFDTVVSTFALCTLVDPLAALREMKRVCKPKGRILLMEHGRSSAGWIGRWQDRRVDGKTGKAGCRMNQEPQQVVRAAGLRITSARRAFLGILHLIQVSPA